MAAGPPGECRRGFRGHGQHDYPHGWRAALLRILIALCKRAARSTAFHLDGDDETDFAERSREIVMAHLREMPTTDIVQATCATYKAKRAAATWASSRTSSGKRPRQG